MCDVIIKIMLNECNNPIPNWKNDKMFVHITSGHLSGLVESVKSIERYYKQDTG